MMDCMAAKLVKVGRMGGTVKEYMVTGSTVISDILRMAGLAINPDTEQLVINGSTTELGAISSFVSNNMTILIQNKLKSIIVKVARVGCALIPVKIPEGSYVRTAIRQSGLLQSPDEEIWLHKNGGTKGEKVKENDWVNDNDVIILEKPKKSRDPRVEEIVSIMGDYLQDSIDIMRNTSYDEMVDRIEKVL